MESHENRDFLSGNPPVGQNIAPENGAVLGQGVGLYAQIVRPAGQIHLSPAPPVGSSFLLVRQIPTSFRAAFLQIPTWFRAAPLGSSDSISCKAPSPFSAKFRPIFVHPVSEFRLRFVQGSPSLLPRIPIRFRALFLQNPTWFRAAPSGIPTHFRAGAPTDAALSGVISPGNSGRIFLHFVAVPPGKFPFLVIFCPFSAPGANGASGACLT